MIINREKKYIFIHIPRTSGTNLYDCLSGDKYDSESFGHVFARKIRDRFKNEFDKFTTFSIVRNDFERMHSWWFNRRFLRNYDVGTVSVGFKDWLIREPYAAQDVHNNWDSSVWRIGAQRTSQLEWITNTNRDIIIDHVLRYENLAEELEMLGEVIGEDFSIMPAKGTGRNDSIDRESYRNAYDQEMIDFMNRYHIDSLNHFNYEF